MCFNAEVSLITYIIGLFGSFYLYQQNYKPEAIFYGLVIQMQLIEFLLWKNQPCNGNDEKNKKISTVGLFINHIEPFILWFAIIYFSKIKLPIMIHIFMCFFAILTFFYVKNILKDIQCTTVTEESEPHLHWLWNEGENKKIFYILFLLSLIFLSYYGLEHGVINSFLVLFSFSISLAIYGKKHSAGAMWCFAAAFAPIILSLIYHYLNKI
jgi:hypothetical protein